MKYIHWFDWMKLSKRMEKQIEMQEANRIKNCNSGELEL